jgi:hypothetical protein
MTIGKSRQVVSICKRTHSNEDADAAKMTPTAETTSASIATKLTSVTQPFTPTQSKNTPLVLMENCVPLQLLVEAEAGPEKM